MKLLADLTERAAKVDALCKEMNERERAFLENRTTNRDANMAAEAYGRARARFGEYLLQRSDEILAALKYVGWRPASEPPDKSGWYHVWPDEQQFTKLGRNDTPTAYFYSSGGGHWDWRGAGKVSHWMPLIAGPTCESSGS